MRLLIITQKVDKSDDLLGFFHGWLSEFASRCEKLIAVCLEKGEYELPKNVEVISLGKEMGNRESGIGKRIKYVYYFYRAIWQERKEYDCVFVHMNPMYIILGGVIWKIWGKEIGLWYLHKRVDLKLRIAEKIAGIIFTASPESFRLKSKKVKIVGHGIDLNKFKVQSASWRTKFKVNGIFSIIYAGRISRIKDQRLLIEAADILVNKKDCRKLMIDLVGGAVYEDDRRYMDELKALISEKDLQNNINFIGPVSNSGIAGYYGQADLSINLCPTGGMDKAVLESMACGLPVIVYNKTFAELLSGHGQASILRNADKEELAEKISDVMKMDNEERIELGKEYRKRIEEKFELKKLIAKIVDSYL